MHVLKRKKHINRLSRQLRKKNEQSKSLESRKKWAEVNRNKCKKIINLKVKEILFRPQIRAIFQSSVNGEWLLYITQYFKNLSEQSFLCVL